MSAGKIFIILGAILTLVSTYFLSLFNILIPAPALWLEAGTLQANGITFFTHIIDLFTDANAIATTFYTESYLVYIFSIILIFWAISGIIQLIGIKSRAAAIIGSIMPLFIGIICLLSMFMVLPDFLGVIQLFIADSSLVSGIIPYDIPLSDISLIFSTTGKISLGSFLLIGGGVLGLIGGIMGTSD